MTIGIIFLLLILAQGYWTHCRVGKQNEDLQDSLEWMSSKAIEALKENDEMRTLLKGSMPKEGTIELIQWLYEHVGEKPLPTKYAERLLEEFYKQRKEKNES